MKYHSTGAWIPPVFDESAYYRAEKRGFDPGHETEDWLAAEAEVDALLLKTVTTPRV